MAAYSMQGALKIRGRNSEIWEVALVFNTRLPVLTFPLKHYLHIIWHNSERMWMWKDGYKTYLKLVCNGIFRLDLRLCLFVIRILTWSQKWSFKDDLDSGLCWYLLIGRSHPVEKDWDDSPSLIVQERCHGIPMDFRVASWLGGPVIFLPRPYLPWREVSKFHAKKISQDDLISDRIVSSFDLVRIISHSKCPSQNASPAKFEPNALQI